MAESSRKPPLLTQTEGAQELVRAVLVAATRPYAAGKLGTSEFEALYWYVEHRRQKKQKQFSIHYILFVIC